MHLDRLAELVIESEADKQRDVSVYLQLGALAKLPGALHPRWMQPQAHGEVVNNLIGRILDIEPEG